MSPLMTRLCTWMELWPFAMVPFWASKAIIFEMASGTVEAPAMIMDDTPRASGLLNWSKTAFPWALCIGVRVCIKLAVELVVDRFLASRGV